MMAPVMVLSKVAVSPAREPGTEGSQLAAEFHE